MPDLIHHPREQWRLTGNICFARGILGTVRVVVEEQRPVFDPIYTGHTPANWRMETRWRRAKFSDIRSIRLAFYAPNA